MFTISNIVELVLLVCTLLPVGLAALKRLAVANHNDYWGRILGAGERLASEIAEVLLTLPVGADVAAVRQALIAKAVGELQTEFDTSIAKTGATADRLAVTIDRMVSGRIVPNLAQAATKLVPALSPTETPAS